MTVTDSPDVAVEVARSGGRCVLIAPALPEGWSGGRIALLVGDPSDPAVRAVAATMDEELFGPAT